MTSEKANIGDICTGNREPDMNWFFKNILQMKDKDLISEAYKYVDMKFYEKGEVLYHEEEPIRRIYLLASEGVAASFSSSPEGKQMLGCFENRLGYPLVPNADLYQPCEFSVKCLTDLYVLAVDLNKVDEWSKRFPEIKRMVLEMVVHSWSEHVEYRKIVYKMNAEQRLRWFMERFPNLIYQIPDKYIAEFLKMHQVHLSRVKKIILEEQ